MQLTKKYVTFALIVLVSKGSGRCTCWHAWYKNKQRSLTEDIAG